MERDSRHCNFRTCARGQDRGAPRHRLIYAQLLNDAVASMICGNCAQIVIDDGRYGPETLALSAGCCTICRTCGISLL
jgi:hypothetical protein